MAYSLKTNFISSFSNETLINNVSMRIHPSSCVLTPSSKNIMGKPFCLLSDHNQPPLPFTIHAQASICVSKWWNKTLKPNMIEINSAQHFEDSLSNAGDRLVIVGFYSPGCGGCKSLHPKICQLAESNSNALFLKVNYDELKTMCHCLNIHVLPFFRFYRGSEGRLCSFSCTNATIKKLKDALAKYGTDGYSPGPAKGVDESELLSLAAKEDDRLV